MNTTTPAIEAHDLVRVYRARSSAVRRALDGVSIRVERGEWVALLGPNGSGKSTLLRILATLDAPTSGALRVLGHPRPAQARRSIGVVFQREALDPLLTGRENLRAHARLFGLVRSDAEAAIQRVGASLGVLDRLGDRVATLSGGLRRRVDLARALLTAPDALYLDEPTTGLDHAARAEFLDALRATRRERPTTIVFSTHLMDEAAHADRVVMLGEGRVVLEGVPSHLRASLGDAVLRTGDERAAREIFLRAGLSIGELDGGLVATGSSEAAASAAAALTGARIAFSFGPPTLGDVYLSRTGHALAAGARAENAP